MSILACMAAEKSLTKNFILQSMEGKKSGQMQGRISRRSWFSIPRYIKSSSTCILNISILACMVVEKSLTKNFILQSMEGKKSEQMQVRISCRKLVLNSTIQQAVINLSTKYEHSSLHGCGEIFDKKFHQ